MDSEMFDKSKEECRINELESLVDDVGFATVLESLAEVASLKAEHLSSNWQDYPAAKEYERRAKLLITCAGRMGSP